MRMASAIQKSTSKAIIPTRKRCGACGKRAGLAQKLANMTEDDMIDLLASDGMLVKRPLLVTESAALPGFREADWKAALGIQQN